MEVELYGRAPEGVSRVTQEVVHVADREKVGREEDREDGSSEDRDVGQVVRIGGNVDVTINYENSSSIE